MGELRPSQCVLIVFRATFITAEMLFIALLIFFIASSWITDRGLEMGMVLISVEKPN